LSSSALPRELVAAAHKPMGFVGNAWLSWAFIGFHGLFIGFSGRQSVHFGRPATGFSGL